MTRSIFSKSLRDALALLALAAPLALPTAQTAQMDARVVRTLASAESFGGCMVRLSVAPADTGLNCPDRWVTFGCNGDFGSKADAQRMFDSAQMAFAMGRQVRVWVDDERKIGSFCAVKRIDVLAE